MNLRAICEINVTGKTFSHNEAGKFQEIYRLQNILFHIVKQKTNCDPLLL